MNVEQKGAKARLKKAATAYERARVERDDALKAAHAAGVPVRPDIIEASGLSRPRIYVILGPVSLNQDTPDPASAPVKKASPRRGLHTLRDAEIVDPATKYRQP